MASANSRRDAIGKLIYVRRLSTYITLSHQCNSVYVIHPIHLSITTGNTGATYRIWAMNLSGTAYQYCEGKTVYGVPQVADAIIRSKCIEETIDAFYRYNHCGLCITYRTTGVGNSGLYRVNLDGSPVGTVQIYPNIVPYGVPHWSVGRQYEIERLDRLPCFLGYIVSVHWHLLNHDR